MRLSLRPTDDRCDVQEATSYIVRLPHSDSALIEMLSNGGWRLVVYTHGIRVDRGLFGSSHDILTLLEAEYFPHPDSARYRYRPVA